MVDAGGMVIWLRSAREDLVRGTVGKRCRACLGIAGLRPHTNTYLP